MMDFNNSLIQQLKTLSIGVDKVINADLKKMGVTLTGSQVAILTKLYQADTQVLLQQDLESFLHLSHPTTRGFVKRLQQAGYLENSRNPADKRQTIIFLTDQGRQLMNKKAQLIADQLESIEKKAIQGLSANEIAQLKRQLKIIQKNLA